MYADPVDAKAQIQKWLEGVHQRFAPDWLGKQMPVGKRRPAPLIINGLVKVRQCHHLDAARSPDAARLPSSFGLCSQQCHASWACCRKQQNPGICVFDGL